MAKRINIKVFRDGKFIDNNFILVLVKYEGHFDVIKSIYQKQGYTIEVIN